MEFITDYGLFLAKTITLVLAIGIILGLLAAAGNKTRKKGDKGHIEVTRLNDRFKQMAATLKEAMLDDVDRKAEHKAEKKRLKAEKKSAKGKRDETPRKRVFVLDFNGDIKASATDHLREEISSVLSLARPTDEVVVKLESGGGLVHSYGLASSQLNRIRQHQVPLTVCVDKVAASGGYMMACVADRILAAPFAVLGSIGVVAQLPNFHKLLKKNHVDFEVFTAGEYKRTVTMFGENTKKGRDKFIEDLEDTHVLFKEFVAEHRPQLDVSATATGEIWFGRRAQEVKLVDELQTSDEYLLSLSEQADIFEVRYVQKKSLPKKLGFAAEESVDRLLLRWWQRSNSQRWF